MFTKFAKLRVFTSAASPQKSTNWLVMVGIPSVLVAGSVYYYSSSPPKPVPALDPKEWKDFKLKEIIPINHNTKTFRFALPEGTNILGMPTASCFIARFQNGTNEDSSPQYIVRPYTPIEDPADGFTGYFDLIVKKYPTGKMSGHIHGLKVGDTLSIKGPTVKFEYRPNELNEIGMVAGGTGITPMIQVIQRILSNPNDKTKVSLLFANVTEEDILLRKYLEKIVEKNPQQFKVHFVLDKPPKDWTQGSGFINETMLKTYMPAPGQGKVFVCGPPPMMNHVSGGKAKDYSQGEIGGLLKSLGYTENDVFKF